MYSYDIQQERWGEIPNSPYTALALDIGMQKIGVATGSSFLAEATPRDNIKANDAAPHWPQLQEQLKRWKPQLVVIGYPMNMDDSDTFLSPACVRAANKIHGRYQLPVRLVDERLSTREAYDLAINADHQRWKGKAVDALAASVILQTWFQIAQSL